MWWRISTRLAPAPSCHLEKLLSQRRLQMGVHQACSDFPPNPSEGEIRLCVVPFLATFSTSIEKFHEPMGRPFIRSSYRTKHRMILKGCFQVQVLLRRAKGSFRSNLTGRTTHGIPLTSARQHARQSVSFAANSQRRRSESGTVKIHKGFWRRLSDRKACRRQVGMSAD